ncbi:MAG: cytochrome c biogenesis CcdA family protein, partial [Steroidobacteraceae bacterium]
ALAYAGTALGLPPNLGRDIGAVILGLFGVVLLSGFLQRRFAAATAGIGSRANALLVRWQPSGLGGQWLVGAVLGLVWSPCAGPTLGAAIGLASQGQELGPIMVLMGLFGVGAALPLLLVGWLGQRAIGSIRGTIVRAGQLGKVALGATFVVLAVAMLTGWDQHAEAWLVDHSPDWLTALTTRY